MGMGYGPGNPNPPPRPSAAPASSASRRVYPDYESAKGMEADIENDAKNLYTSRGDYDKIGTPAYEDDVEEARVSAGLIAPRSMMARRFARGMGGFGAVGLGYGIMQAGDATARAYEQQNSGAYVTPEEQARQDAGALPGALSVIGALGGAATGIPGASIIGSMALGGVGSMTQSFVGAGEQRAQATRETSETFGASLGVASDKIREFADAIDRANVPVKQFEQVVGAMASTGPLTGGTAALGGAAGMTVALGQYAEQSYSSLAGQLRDPAQFPLSQQLRATGTLDIGGYASLGAQAILDGDPTALLNRQRDIEDYPLAHNAQYARDRNNQASGANSPLSWARLVAGGPLAAYQGLLTARGWLGGRRADATQADTPVDPSVASLDAYSRDYGASEYATVTDQGAVGLASGALEAAGLRGGSMADIAAAGHSLYGSLGTAIGNEHMRRDVIQRMMDDPKFAGDRTGLQRALNQSDLTAQGYENAQFDATRQVFTEGLKSDTAGYSLRNTQDTLAGRSDAQQAPRERAFMAHLMGVATDPNSPLSPSDRSQLQSQSLQGGYEIQMGIYAQTLGQNSANTASAAVGVTRAQSYGGPSDVAGAQSQVLSEYMSRIRELNDELSHGSLTVNDRISAERQLDEVRGNAISLQASIGRDESLGYSSLANTSRATAGIGLDRIEEIGGSAALPGAALRARDAGALSAAQNIVANNPQQQADKDQAVRLAQFQQAETLTRLATFAPDERTRESELSARTDLQIARVSPFADGSPASNPWQATAGLLSVQQRELGAAQAADRGLTEANDPGGLGRFANRQYEDSLRVQMAGERSDQWRAGLEMLPEMVAGMPGRGYGAQLMPRAGVSALFSPNPMVSGSYGPGHDAPMVSATPMLAGGMAGGFGAATGAHDQTALLAQAVRFLEQIARNGGTSALARTSTPGTNAGTQKMQQNATFNPNRR
jgi:hypothetical protein